MKVKPILLLKKCFEVLSLLFFKVMLSCNFHVGFTHLTRDVKQRITKLGQTLFLEVNTWHHQFILLQSYLPLCSIILRQNLILTFIFTKHVASNTLLN
jgi:hypothetical protein